MKPDTRWDHLVDTVLWQPPDKSFSKNIIEHGHGISAPREGATCQVVVNQLTDCALDEETCTVKLGVPTEITVGDGDLPIDEIIDKCVESMKRGEVCEVSFPHPAVWRAPPGVSVCGDDGKTVMARSSTAIVPEDNEGTRHPVESEVSAAVADGTSHDPAEHTADRTSRDSAERTTDGTSRDLAERTADAADGASCDPMEHTTNATDRTSRDPSERTADGTARDPIECSGNITDRTLSEPVEHTADRTARDVADRGDDSARLRLRVSLLGFPDDVTEVWAMTTSDRLRVAARHKHAGVALFHRGALAPAVTRFNRALRYLATVCPDLATLDADPTTSNADPTTSNPDPVTSNTDPTDEDVAREARALTVACRLNIAACQLRVGSHRYVVDNCTRALAADPRSPKALYRRGRAYAALAEYKRAHGDLAAALRVEPRNASVRAELERVRALERAANEGLARGMKKMFSST